jgi:TetR/AcrR family fatty acid metabolism transcriptional regulator
MEQEQRRQHIIDSTIRVLARDGLTGASLSRVAAEAGAAKGILCYYFTNKDGLFDAVLGYVQNSMLNAALRNADQGADCWQQVSNFIVAHLDYVNDNRDEVLAIRNLGSTRAGGSDVSDHLSIWTNQRDWLIAALSSGQSLGEFKDFDAGIASTAILGAMESALIQWAHDPAVDMKTTAEHLVRFFEASVRKEKSPVRIWRKRRRKLLDRRGTKESLMSGWKTMVARPVYRA